MDKYEINNIYYELNKNGYEFKRETIGKPISDILATASFYFCKYYCKYAEFCGEYEEYDPWCPIEELR